MVRAGDDGRAEAVPFRGLEREAPRAEFVLRALDPRDVPPLEGARLLLRPAVERDAEEEKDVGRDCERGPRRAEGAEGEAGEDERAVPVLRAEEADGRDEVLRLAPPFVPAPR